MVTEDNINADNFFFMVDNNCDGINESAISFKNVDENTLDQIIAFGVPYGKSDGLVTLRDDPGHNANIFPLLFNLDNNTLADSIDIGRSGRFDKLVDLNLDDTPTPILTITFGSDSTWSTKSEDADEAVTSCGGNYASCLMGQADPSRVNSGNDDVPSNAFSGASFDISLQNTEPEGEASWDVANYTAENSCAISPNMCF